MEGACESCGGYAAIHWEGKCHACCLRKPGYARHLEDEVKRLRLRVSQPEAKRVLYKLTDGNDQTFGGCQWGEGVENTAPGTGELCTAGWLHACTDPLLAVMLNPIYADLDLTTAHLWEAEGDVGRDDHGLQVGCTRLKTLRRIALPSVSLEARIRFGICCALAVCEEPPWIAWANGWLSGRDHSSRSAWGAWASAEAEAARGAAWLASASAAEAAAWSTWAAWASAGAAAWAASAAGAAQLDLARLAREAIEAEGGKDDDANRGQ